MIKTSQILLANISVTEKLRINENKLLQFNLFSSLCLSLFLSQLNGSPYETCPRYFSLQKKVGSRGLPMATTVNNNWKELIFLCY